MSHARVDRRGGIETDWWQAPAFVGGTACQFFAGCRCLRLLFRFISARAYLPVHICPVRAATPPDPGRARAVLVCDELSWALVLEMKHAECPDILPILAQCMAQGPGDLTGYGPMLIVPVAAPFEP